MTNSRASRTSVIQDSATFTVRGACNLLVLLLPGCAVGLTSMAGFFPTPVCQEIVAGNLGRAMQLVGDGADPNAGHGCALVSAASRGELHMVQFLLDHGANPNRTVSGDLTVVMGGATPLVAGVQSRNVQMVRLLLERGANPREDFHAFEIVINFADVEMAALLLRHGANPNMRYPTGEEVYAFVGGPTESRMVTVPQRDLAPDRIDDTAKRLQCGLSFLSEPTTLLHLAAGGKKLANQEIVKLLLDHGADPNVRTLNGKTPLMIASRWTGSPRTVSMLKTAGADVNAVDRCGRTVEDYAKMFP